MPTTLSSHHSKIHMEQLLREKLLYLPGTKSIKVAAFESILLSFPPITQKEVSSLLIKAQRKSHLALDPILRII